MIVLGSVGILGSFSVYFTSYFKSINPSLSLYYSYFYQSISTFFATIFGFIGGFIEHKFGANITILSGGIVKFFWSNFNAFCQKCRIWVFLYDGFWNWFQYKYSNCNEKPLSILLIEKGTFLCYLQSMMNLNLLDSISLEKS